MYFQKSMKHSQKIVLKFSSLLLGFTLTAMVALGQTIAVEAVPQSVRTAFDKSQSVSEATWAEAPMGNYAVRFHKSGHDLVYVYSSQGQLTTKKKVVNPILIPNSIHTHLASNHSSYEVKEVFQIISREKVKYYEVEAGNATSSKQICYSLAGAYISTLDLTVAEVVPITEVETPEAVTTPEVASTLAVASTNSNLPQPVATSGGMRGDSDDGFEDIELIDDDIADLFEDEEDDSILTDPADSNNDDWDDILFEEEDEDDLGDWDIPEGDDL